MRPSCSRRSGPSLLTAVGLAVGLACVVAQAAAAANPFFAMDTALRDGKARSAEEQAALLRELGYDGIGASGHLSGAFLAAFEKQGLKVFNTYLTLSFDSGKPGPEPRLKEFVPRLKGHGTALWVAINEVTREGTKLRPSSPDGDEVVVPALRELADLARASEVKIALYPHVGCWVERVEDAFRVARKTGRSNVGATFNLCHWLKVEGDRDPKPVLQDAMPLLFFVSVNGADAGDTRKMNWDRLIQPLDQGTYDVAGLVRLLRELGYAGPVGFQGYGIKGDSRDILQHTMAGWRKMQP